MNTLCVQTIYLRLREHTQHLTRCRSLERPHLNSLSSNRSPASCCSEVWQSNLMLFFTLQLNEETSFQHPGRQPQMTVITGQNY